MKIKMTGANINTTNMDMLFHFSLRNFVKESGSIIMFIMLWILASLFVPHFASVDNNLVILRNSAIPIIACIGITMVLVIGGIDLSIGFIVGFCSIFVGMLIMTYHLPISIAILLTLLLGGFFGYCNGMITQRLKVPSFITTLGTGFIIYGLAQIISGGNVINQLPESFLALGKSEIFGIQMVVYISIVIAIISYFILHKTIFGRSLFAMGMNSEASHLSGIKVAKYTVLTYLICGTLAAVAGILLTIKVNSGQPDMGGSSFTFEVITAVIVGGTSLFGGVGKITGSVFGVLVIKLVENCINLLGVSHYMYQAFIGLIILAAIILENIKNRTLV
jgi:ribose/xylose/arabinose/galactoside ABC-type transport system permease subunit